MLIRGSRRSIKIGAGTFILTGAGNTYSGGTTVSGGILLANNVAGSATGAGLVTVASGGTLGGTGIISGAVTVNSGGGFAPGNPLGTLTISNNLTLAAGSATLIQVQHAPHTNNAVKITGALAEGGALNVTNISATPLAGGDAFVLFNAASYGGAFANMVLPALPAGLAWNTNALKTNGTLSVVIAAGAGLWGCFIIDKRPGFHRNRRCGRLQLLPAFFNQRRRASCQLGAAAHQPI